MVTPGLVWGQGVVVRSKPVSADTNASNFNKQVTQDANVQVKYTFQMPVSTSGPTRNNATPANGQIVFNTPDTTLYATLNGAWVPIKASSTSSLIYFNWYFGGAGTIGDPVTIIPDSLSLLLAPWRFRGNIVKNDSVRIGYSPSTYTYLLPGSTNLFSPTNYSGWNSGQIKFTNADTSVNYFKLQASSSVNTVVGSPTQFNSYLRTSNAPVVGNDVVNLDYFNAHVGGTTIYTGDGTLAGTRYVHNGGFVLKTDSLQVLNPPVNQFNVINLAYYQSNQNILGNKNFLGNTDFKGTVKIDSSLQITNIPGADVFANSAPTDLVVQGGSNVFTTPPYRMQKILNLTSTVGDYYQFATMQSFDAGTAGTTMDITITGDVSSTNSLISKSYHFLLTRNDSSAWEQVRPLSTEDTTSNFALEVKLASSTWSFRIRRTSVQLDNLGSPSNTGIYIWAQTQPIFTLSGSSITGNDVTTIPVFNLSQITQYRNNLYDSNGVAFAKVGGGGVGTVTSIAPGVGFVSHTPITISGTMNVDTTLVATRAYVNGFSTFFSTQFTGLGTSGSPITIDTTNMRTVANSLSLSAAQTKFNLKANIASPTFTGTPAAPTAAPGTNTTQLASTAFVMAAVSAGTPTGANPTASIGFTAVNGSSANFTRADGAPKADSTIIASTANHPTLAQLQTKVNNYLLIADTTSLARKTGNAVMQQSSYAAIGTGGLGFLSFLSQSASPSRVSGILKLYRDSVGSISYMNGLVRRTLKFTKNGDITTSFPYKLVSVLADSTDVAASIAGLSSTYVPYTGATGNVNLGANTLTVKGVTSSFNTTSYSSIFPSQTQFYFVGQDANSAVLQGQSFAGHVVFEASRANGTAASPTAIIANDELGTYAYNGWDGTSYGEATASVQGTATQNFTSSAHGTQLILNTTPNGSTTLTAAAVADQSGDFGIARHLLVGGTLGANLSSYGSGSIVATVLANNNASGRAALELYGNVLNTGNVTSEIDFGAQSNTIQSNQRIVQFYGLPSGATAGNKGGALTIATKANAGSLTNALQISNTQVLTFNHYTTNGGIFYGDGSGNLTQTGAGTSTTLLHGGTSPAYSAVSLTADVTGVLPVANIDTTTIRTVANSRTLAQTQTALNLKLNISDTTAMLNNVLHKNLNETILGLKTAQFNNIASTITPGFVIANNQVLTTGQAQLSPALKLSAPAFGTTLGTSQPVDWYVYSSGIAGTTPTGQLVFASGVGAATPGARVSFNTNASITAAGGNSVFTNNRTGIAATTTSGIISTNSTAATSGVAEQRAPASEWNGHVWNTTATAADNVFGGRVDVRGISGTTPTAKMFWQMGTGVSTITYTDRMSLDNAGTLSLLAYTTKGMLANSSAGVLSSFADGTANQVLGMNSGATGYEYKTITAGNGVSVTHGANSITIAEVLRYAHNISTPTTGGTVNLTNNQYNIINPAGALLALTVNLPSSPVNNDLVYIKFTQNVTTVTYTGGTVVDGITAPTVGGLTILVYDSGTTSWY